MSTTTSARTTVKISALSWSDCLAWLLSVGAIPRAIHRILLYSPEPGTGKSSWATKAFGAERVERVQCHPQQSPEDLLYGTIGLHEGNTVTQPGSVLRALRGGKCLVLDEICDASPDVFPILHSVLDDREIAGVTVPETGERVAPHRDYCVVATTNGEPTNLPPALLSRFDLVLLCNRPSAGIVEKLRNGTIPGLSQAIERNYSSAKERWVPKLDVRSGLALSRLAEFVTPEDAAELIFGKEGIDLLAGLSTTANL